MHQLVAGPDLDDLLAPYRTDRIPDRARCWVMANMVAGLDGTAAFDGRVGPLNQGADVDLFRLVRSLADVVLVGAQTVRREGYGPVRLSGERRRARAAAGKLAVPPLAIITRSGALEAQTGAIALAEPESRTLVITGEYGQARLPEATRRLVETIVAGKDEVDLRLALDLLYVRGHRTVLCEGGPHVLGQLAALGLLDELCLTISPLTGGDPLPVAVTPPGAGATAYRLAHVLEHDSTLFLRYLKNDRVGSQPDSSAAAKAPTGAPRP